MKSTSYSLMRATTLAAMFLAGAGLVYAQTSTSTNDGTSTSTPPTLSVAVTATPSSGTAPLSGVDLKAVVSGTATGSVDYFLYCDRSDALTTATSPKSAELLGTTSAEYLVMDLCGYSSAGTYTAKAVAMRGGLAAEARTTITVTAPTPPPAPAPAPAPTTTPVMQKGEWKLEIGPSGRVLLRGNLDSVSGNTLKVKSWGGIWTVRVPAGAEVLAHDARITDLTQLQSGDYVGVQGLVSSTEIMTIDGKVVRNWTERKRIMQDKKDNEKLWKRLIKDTRNDDLMSDRIVEGTVGTTSGNSFTLTDGGVTITVNTTASTKFIDKNWASITLADIKIGNRVRVFGDVTGATSITAEVVRNTSTTREAIKMEKEKHEKKGDRDDHDN
jgi:hypothetical protein